MDPSFQAFARELGNAGPGKVMVPRYVAGRLC